MVFEIAKGKSPPLPLVKGVGTKRLGKGRASLECYNLFSGVKLSIRSFCFIPTIWKLDEVYTRNGLAVLNLMRDHLKLRLHDAIYRLRFSSNSLTRILLLSNSHNNVASVQKKWGDKSHLVIEA